MTTTTIRISTGPIKGITSDLQRRTALRGYYEGILLVLVHGKTIQFSLHQLL